MKKVSKNLLLSGVVFVLSTIIIFNSNLIGFTSDKVLLVASTEALVFLIVYFGTIVFLCESVTNFILKKFECDLLKIYFPLAIFTAFACYAPHKSILLSMFGVFWVLCFCIIIETIWSIYKARKG